MIVPVKIKHIDGGDVAFSSEQHSGNLFGAFNDFGYRSDFEIECG